MIGDISYFIIGTCSLNNCGGPVSAMMNNRGLLAKQEIGGISPPYCLECCAHAVIEDMGKWGPVIDMRPHKGTRPTKFLDRI